MTPFEYSLEYALDTEGVDSNHPLDSGKRTRFGITEATAAACGYDVRTLTRDDAAAIYRKVFWKFDAIRSPRVAAKCFDIVINTRPKAGAKILQRAAGAKVDGILGPKTIDALNNWASEDILERLSQAIADHYVEVCKANPSQLAFLKGWMRRAVRRPRLDVERMNNH